MATAATAPVFVTPVTSTLGAIQGTVGASNVLTLKLPTGQTYYGIILECLATATPDTVAHIKNDIAKVRVLVSGEPVIDLSATELFDMELFEGGSNTAGYLYIPLSLKLVRDYAAAYLYALGTASGLTGAQLEVTMNSGTLTVTNINVFGLIDNVERPLGAHRRIISSRRAFGTTGYDEINDVMRPQTALLRQLHVTNATNLTKVKVSVSGNLIKSDVPIGVINKEAASAGFVPVSGYGHINFDLLRNGRQGLPLGAISNLGLSTNWSSSPTAYNTIQDYIEHYGAANLN